MSLEAAHSTGAAFAGCEVALALASRVQSSLSPLPEIAAAAPVLKLLAAHVVAICCTASVLHFVFCPAVMSCPSLVRE